MLSDSSHQFGRTKTKKNCITFTKLGLSPKVGTYPRSRAAFPLYVHQRDAMHRNISRKRKKSPKLRPSFPAYIPTPLRPNREDVEKNRSRHRESNTSQTLILSLSSFSRTHTFFLDADIPYLLPPPLGGSLVYIDLDN